MESAVKKKYINPDLLPDWSDMFSQVVKSENNGLNFVHISGQVGVGPDKQLVGNGSFQE